MASISSCMALLSLFIIFDNLNNQSKPNNNQSNELFNSSIISIKILCLFSSIDHNPWGEIWQDPGHSKERSQRSRNIRVKEICISFPKHQNFFAGFAIFNDEIFYWSFRDSSIKVQYEGLALLQIFRLFIAVESYFVCIGRIKFNKIFDFVFIGAMTLQIGIVHILFEDVNLVAFWADSRSIWLIYKTSSTD